jgi:hypothetical protein
MTPQQLKKLERLAKVLDNGDVELLTQLDQLETKTEKEIQAIYKLVMEALSVAEQTKKLEGKKGEKGDKGERGERGKDGRDGIDGKDGKNGLDGKDGLQGVPGKDGIDGKDGKDGEKGADGFIDDATVGYLESELKRIDKKNGGYGQVVRKLRAGNNIVIDETNMEYPTISVDPQITVSDTAPTAPATNDIWIDTNAYTYRAVTSTYTITLEDYLLDCSGTFTITLPTAVGFTGEYIIKNTGTGIITVDGNGSQTIDGVTTFALIEDEVITLRSTGTNWLII